MNYFSVILLSASVSCSTARAVFSKKLGLFSESKKSFYTTQALLFFSAAIFIFLFNKKSICVPSGITLILALAYGLFTVLAQWMYTIALSRAQVSVCAMVYSFGFIIPTVFGTVVWNEKINALKIISVLLCLFTIVLTSLNKNEKSKAMHGSFLPLIISMIASGGLGVVQKLQQKSNASLETGTFLFLAFILAAALSLFAALTLRKKSKKKSRYSLKSVFYIIIVGASMAAANTANTLLAGRLPSIIAFPVVNIGVILASLAVSVIFLKEKITRNQLIAIMTGLMAILLFVF